MKVPRFDENPVIRPQVDDRTGDNVNGPSLIRAPDCVTAPLGRYYLCFGNHQGNYIRLAFAGRLEGPWRIHGPGVLDLSDSFLDAHIASPVVHVIDEAREIRMYHHGAQRADPPRRTIRLAISHDATNFTARLEILGSSCWRAFRFRGYWCTLEMPGTFRRSVTGVSDFEGGPRLFTPDMRHSAVRLNGDTLTVFYSNAGDCPERILVTTVDLHDDWLKWRAEPPETPPAGESDYEGAERPPEPSGRGLTADRVHQLCDPCVFEGEGGGVSFIFRGGRKRECDWGTD